MVFTRSLALLAIYLVSSSTALPILRNREVPQGKLSCVILLVWRCVDTTS